MDAKVVWLTDTGIAILKDKLEKVHRIAEKLGVEPPKYSVGGSEIRTIAVPDRQFGPEAPALKMTVKFNEVSIWGVAPKLSGWQFLATLQHENDAEKKIWNNVIRSIPGCSVEDEKLLFDNLAHAEPRCDHCGKVRMRKDTYVVKKENGTDTGTEWKQVGSGCLKDFLGHKSPQAIADYIEALFDMEFDEREYWGGSGYPRPEEYMDVTEYLAHVACMMRVSGWVSKKMIDEGTARTGSMPTSTAAQLNIHNQQRWNGKGKADFEPPTAPDYDLARKALSWVRNDLSMGAKPGFESNLVTACASDRTNVRNAGIVGATIASYQRAEQRRIAAEKLNEKNAMQGEAVWIGEVGKKVEVEVTIMRIIEHQSDFGVTNIHVMETATGSKLVWFASGGRTLGGAQAGWSGMISGTVKAHGIDRRSGAKETVISRCKVA